MRRIGRISIPLLVAATMLASCGDGGDGAAELVFPEQTLVLPDTSEAGTIAGRVSWTGAAPNQKRLRPPTAHCAKDGHEILDETFSVQDGRLANVLVYVKKGAESYTFEHVRTEAVVDQALCVFKPHVIAVQTHQPVRFKNSDPLVHNVNSTTSAQKQGFNYTITPKMKSKVWQFPKPEIRIPVICDLHGNMFMYIHVLEHPWHRVTGTDGTFDLGQLPPGDYEIAAVHEKLGEKTRTVTLQPGAAIGDLEFSFQR